MKGQVLVEFALTLPILLSVILGGIEAGFLLIAKAEQDRTTQVIADWAALHPGDSWNSVAAHELPGCAVSVSSPFRDVLEAVSQCQYHPKVLVGPMTFELTIVSSETTALQPLRNPESTPASSLLR